jgi:hypothetical protein
MPKIQFIDYEPLNVSKGEVENKSVNFFNALSVK